MSEKLLSFCDGKKSKNVGKVLSSMQLEEIFDTLAGQIKDGGEKAVILMRVIFQGLSDVEECHEKRNKITKQLFTLLNTDDISTKVTCDLIGFLLLELDNTPVKNLVELMEFILENIEQGSITNGKSLELLPKVLSSASSYGSIPIANEGTMAGPEYRRMIIDKFCNMRWLPNIVMFMASMLRDIQMNNEELGIVIRKIIKVFKDVTSLQEIPSLVYQTLLLSNKGYRSEVLDGIVTFFFEKSKQTDEDLNPLLQDDNETLHLRSVEGTVLLHIIFAAKQDQDLGREYLKYLKSSAQTYPEKLLSPFAIGLTLAMTHIHRLEEQLFDFLKSFILKTFKDDERRKNSKWTRELFSENFAVEDAVLATVKNSKIGWDHVTHGLINLAFMLIDSYTPKQTEHFSILSNAHTPSQRACKLGTTVIQEIFKKQEISREEILQRLLDVIMTKALSNVQHYLDTLKSVVASVPQIVLDCLPKFREVFDYLSMLSPITAEGILRAVLPLMKVSMSIKDSLIVVLRKSMFSKQAEARKVAVIGYLLILKHFKIDCDGASQSLSSQINLSQSFSCSQVEINTQGRYNVGANEALCLEIIGSLRKSLTQHGDVRMELYNGIYEVVCKNPVLSHAILDLLYQQFLRYYVEETASLPPIKLSLCFSSSGELHLIEPLVHLLSALMLCLKKAGRRLDKDVEENERLSNLLDEAEECLTSLTKRMIKTEFGDFDLDKTSDYNTSTEIGLKNTYSAQIILGVYEILIEYTYTTNEIVSVEDSEIISQLFKKHQNLTEIMKEKSAGSSGGKKSRSSTSKNQVKSLLSFKCLSTMLSAILCSTEVTLEPGLNVLRQSVDYAKFLTSTVLAKLQQLVDSRYCDGAGGKNLEHIFRHCETLAKVFLQHINGDCVLSDEVLKKDKGRKLGNLCLDGLSHIVEFVGNHMPEQLGSLLKSMDFSPDVISQNDVVTDGSLVFRIIRRMQRLTIKIIVSPDEDLGLKEAYTLISMFSHLIQHLDQDTEVLQIYTWFCRVAAEHNIDDIALTKSIVTKLLHLHHICKTNNSTITKLSQDIHSKVSDIDEDVEVEDRNHFSIINEKTATPTVFVVVLNHIEKILDEVDWALAKLKNIPNDSGEEGNEEREKKHVCIAQMLIGIVLSLHELSQSAFPLGISADTITKVVTKMYTILGTFAKHYLWLYAQKKGSLTPKFERLVKLTGSHLAQQVYAMITYMQCTQTQTLQEQSMNGKQKSKDRKKANLAGKNRALKESRSIPNLIYSIEQFERYLIQLSKKCKVDLMENMRRSTSRDFRINAASLEAALHEVSMEDENEVEVLEADTSNTSKTSDTSINDEAPSSKRAKLSKTRNPLSAVGNK